MCFLCNSSNPELISLLHSEVNLSDSFNTLNSNNNNNSNNNTTQTSGLKYYHLTQDTSWYDNVKINNNTIGEKIMTKSQILQEPFLNALRKEKIPVSIYLVNGIKLQGQVDSFDQYVIILKNTVNQMVYKHAISTIVPSKTVKMQTEGQD